jgi:hypothetical protein
MINKDDDVSHKNNFESAKIAIIPKIPKPKDQKTKSFLFAVAPVVTAVRQKVAALRGDKVSLTCSVISVPKPDVRWFFNRRQLKMDSNHIMEERGDHNYSLTVANVREADLGEYTCSAVNKITEGQAVISLLGIEHNVCHMAWPDKNNFDDDVFFRYSIRCGYNQFIQREIQAHVQPHLDRQELLGH